MKELYTSPEAQVVCFAPVENLANIIDFSDLYEAMNGGEGGGLIGSGGNKPGSGGWSIPI